MNQESSAAANGKSRGVFSRKRAQKEEGKGFWSSAILNEEGKK
jgi:hypothetical protein